MKKTTEFETNSTTPEIPDEMTSGGRSLRKAEADKINEQNIEKLNEMQEAHDFGKKYDDLILRTNLIVYNSDDYYYSKIESDDAIYKLALIERFLKSKNINFNDIKKIFNSIDIFDKSKNFIMRESIGEGKVKNEITGQTIDIKLSVGDRSSSPIIETKDFGICFDWKYLTTLALHLGLFNKQFNKDNSNKNNPEVTKNV